VQSGATDAHFEVGAENFTPDYTNFRNVELMQVERILPAQFFHSYFISFIAIAAYYHPRNVDLERASTITQVTQGPRWFPNEMKEQIKAGDLSVHPFYNNLNTLISEIHSDSAAILMIPIAINPRWTHYHPGFKESVAVNNKIIDVVAAKYKIPVSGLKYETISPEYWHDYSNLFTAGETQKGAFVASEIIAIMQTSK
jgi:hypothetical protein